MVLSETDMYEFAVLYSYCSNWKKTNFYVVVEIKCIHTVLF